MRSSVNILGQKYQLILDTPENNPKLKDVNGYMEPYSKKIVIDAAIIESHKKDPLAAEDLEAKVRQIYRHEIMHCFFTESGISYKFSVEEEDFLVEWIAVQFPKMKKVFEELGVSE